MRSTSSDPPLRAVRLAPAEALLERRPDGAIHLRSPQPLGPYPDKLSERLEHWAAATPDRIFLAARDPAGGWRKVSYARTLATVRSIGEALLTRGLGSARPIVILSGNDIEHALLGLAANYVGIPYAPVSPAYSLVSSDFGKLRHIVSLLTPGLVFAADGAQFERAIKAVVPPDVELVVTRNPLPDRPTTLFEALTATAPTPAVDAAHAAVGPDTIAKFLFTSGSTGMPKGVINTQRMWCANQVMIRQALTYFQDEPPVIVDWAPWHHTAGGNHDVGLVLYNGGTFYIDDGKPMPGAKEVFARSGASPADVGTVVAGNMAQASFDVYCLPRHVVLYSGAPIEVPAHPVQRVCGTGIETRSRALKRSGLRYRIASACIGGGQGITLLIENVDAAKKNGRQ